LLTSVWAMDKSVGTSGHFTQRQPGCRGKLIKFQISVTDQ